jgi:cytochrome P450
MTTDAAAKGCPAHEFFDPLSPEYLADPYAVLASLPLEEGPVFYAPSIGYYVVTRYADVMQVYGDPQTYSAAVAQQPLAALIPEAQQILLDGGHRPQPSMVSLDEPAHARLRRPATRAFTVARVNAMAPTIRNTARELLDAVGDTDRFDLVATLAFPLPANTIFSLLGVPTDDYEQLKRWCGYRAALSWGRPDSDDQVEIAGNLVAYRHYLRDLVEAKMQERADDLTSALLAIHDEDPERLTPAEIASILFSLSFAGHETTTGLIGNTVRRLLEEPARWDALVADRALIPAAVQETLRYDPPVPMWRRVTTRPVTLAGIHLPKGAKVLLWLAATGRDPSVFPDPDRFDLHRTNADKHLAFGADLHYCLGASLGRLEARLAVEELIDRFPHLRLVDGQTLTFHPNISFRGPQALWVRSGPDPAE